MEGSIFQYLYGTHIGDNDISTFIRRLDKGELSCRITFEDFMAEREIAEVVRLLKM